jgi:N-acetylglucosamine-6-phosphate deacetylase
MQILKNARYLNEEGRFVNGDIAFENGVLTDVGHAENIRGAECTDLGGCLVTPGLVDIHTHGALGYDVTTAKPEEIREISRFLACHGVTTFFPTTITAAGDELELAVSRIEQASRLKGLGASIRGVHFEGPYLSPARKGCHDESLLRLPSIEGFDRLRKSAGALRVRLTVAPELKGAYDLISYARSVGTSVTLGHTDADEKTSLGALEAGADSFTHLFNAMRGINHREPGAAGAALVSDAYTELICDGVHIHPDIIKLVCRLKGPDKVVAITDAMNAAGCGDGEYIFCGAKVTVKDGAARDADGTLAGSTLLLVNAVKNFIRFAQVGFVEAVGYATANPARAAGIYDKAGSITRGKAADLAVFGGDGQLEAAFCRGERFMAERG